jgi:hypothetical protein
MVDELFNVEDDKLYDWIDAKLDEPTKAAAPKSFFKIPASFPAGSHITWTFMPITIRGRSMTWPTRVSFSPPMRTGPVPSHLRALQKSGKMLDHQKKRTKKGRGR